MSTITKKPKLIKGIIVPKAAIPSVNREIKVPKVKVPPLKTPKPEKLIRNRLATYGKPFVHTKQCTTESVLEVYNLNWQIKKLPLFVEADNGAKFMADNAFGITKIKDENFYRVLGVARKDYRVSPNSSLIEIAKVLTTFRPSLAISEAGELFEGRIVYIQLGHNDLDISGDKIKSYLVILSSNDCTRKTQICVLLDHQQSHSVFLKQLQENSLKLSHTQARDKRSHDAEKILNSFKNEETKIMETYKKMASISVTQALLDNIIEHTFKLTPSNVSTRKKNICDAFLECLQLEYKAHPSSHTLYDVWKAILSFFTHYSLDTSEKERKEYVLAGGGFKEVNKAWNFILSLV